MSTSTKNGDGTQGNVSRSLSFYRCAVLVALDADVFEGFTPASHNDNDGEEGPIVEHFNSYYIQFPLSLFFRHAEVMFALPDDSARRGSLVSGPSL